MNKEYAYVDGKVIVSDENGKLVQKEYKENIDKILVQENVVEKIENDIKELEEKVSKFKKEKLIKFPAFTLLFLLFAGGMAYMCLKGIPFSMYAMIYLALSSSLLTCCGVILDRVLIFDPMKKLQGDISELEYLKGMLQDQKEVLNEMQKEAILNKDKVEDVKGIKVADKQIIAALENEEYLYYDAGLNLKKYYLLYKKGKLAEKLAKYYNQEGIELVTEFVKENGPRLVRKI